LWPSDGEDYFIESFTLWYFKCVHFKIKIKIIKDEQKRNNKNKRICSAKFGLIQKAALNGLQGRRFPTPVLYHTRYVQVPAAWCNSTRYREILKNSSL
jgi:hypothetical protein